VRCHGHRLLRRADLPPNPEPSAVQGPPASPRPSGLSHKPRPKARQRPTGDNPPIPTSPCRNADRVTGRRADDLAQRAKRVCHGDGDLDAPRLLTAMRRHVTNSPDRKAARSTHAWWRRAALPRPRSGPSWTRRWSEGRRLGHRWSEGSRQSRRLRRQGRQRLGQRPGQSLGQRLGQSRLRYNSSTAVRGPGSATPVFSAEAGASGSVRDGAASPASTPPKRWRNWPVRSHFRRSTTRIKRCRDGGQLPIDCPPTGVAPL
jgi:hypothetical protein